jgi:RHS repeat-associated protein
VKKQKIPGALSWANEPEPGTPWNDGLSGVWSTTIYAGGLYEKRWSSSMPTEDHVYSVRAGGRPIAQMMWRRDVATSSGDEQWRYYHTDFQGTVERTTDETAALVEAASYDAWGQRRHADWSYFGGLSTPGDTRVGYTGHQEDDEWQLSYVDMGGRIYDPWFKRFTSADPIVQAPEYGPSWNRYSYVFNNPLRYTDPTGHEAAGFFSAVTAVVSTIAQVASDVASNVGVALDVNGAITLLSMYASPVTIRESSPLEDAIAREDARIAGSVEELGGTRAYDKTIKAQKDAEKLRHLKLMDLARLAIDGAAVVTLITGAVISGAIPSVLAGAQHTTHYTGNDPREAQMYSVIAPMALVGKGATAVGQAMTPRAGTTFIGQATGPAIIVPKGAVGPSPVTSGKGVQWVGGQGGPGLSSKVSSVRVMDPKAAQGHDALPNGYVSYGNGTGQAVDAATGRTLAKDDKLWHIPLSPR